TKETQESPQEAAWRERVKRHLGKDKVGELAEIYKSLAAEDKMNVELWLGRILKNASAEEVEQVLDQMKWDGLQQAVWIAENQIKGGVSRCIKLLADGNYSVRHAAIETLGKLKIQNPEVIQSLLSKLDDHSDRQVSLAAACALA